MVARTEEFLKVSVEPLLSKSNVDESEIPRFFASGTVKFTVGVNFMLQSSPVENVIVPVEILKENPLEISVELFSRSVNCNWLERFFNSILFERKPVSKFSRLSAAIAR